MVRPACRASAAMWQQSTHDNLAVQPVTANHHAIGRQHLVIAMRVEPHDTYIQCAAAEVKD